MTIEIHERPDAALAALARAFVAAAEGQQGSYGERDPAWLDVLRDGLGHQPYLLLSRGDAGNVDGYLPLALVRSRWFGRFLVGLPYVSHAGVLADDDTAAACLLDAAVELAARLDVDHLELRQARPLDDPRFTVQRGDKVRMTRPLPAAADVLWRELGDKVRNQIRKGERAGLAARFGGADLLDGFYPVLAENMRDLGSPVHPRSLFAAMLAMPDRSAEIVLVERQRRVAAAALLFHGVQGAGAAATSVIAAGSRRVERVHNVNMWMYHRILLRALERRSTELDFGRSSAGSGPHRFKRQWGCRELPTSWHYHVRRGDPAHLRADAARHAGRVAAWKRLPVWLSRALGPRIARGIP